MRTRLLMVTVIMFAVALPGLLSPRPASAEGPKYMVLGSGAYLLDGSTRDRFSDLGWGVRLGVKVRNVGLFNPEQGGLWLNLVYERHTGSKIEKLGGSITERIPIGRFLGIEAYAGLGLGVSQTYATGVSGSNNGGSGENGGRARGRDGYFSGGRNTTEVFGTIGLGLMFGSNIVAEVGLNPFGCVNGQRLSTLNFGVGIAF